MLSDWALVQRITVGQCEQHEDDVKKRQWSPQPRQPNYLRRFLSLSQAELVFPRTSPSVVANRHSFAAKMLFTTKPTNKGKLGASAIQRTKI